MILLQRPDRRKDEEKDRQTLLIGPSQLLLGVQKFKSFKP